MEQHFVKTTPKILVKKSSIYVYPYLEVWHMGKRSRINIRCKVLASQWCKDKHRAFISPLLSNLDNLNNSLANENIETYISHYTNFINYLHNNPSRVANFHNEFKEYMNRKTNRQPQQKQSIDVFETIKQSIENNTQLSEKTRQNNYIGKGLKAFTAFSNARREPISSFDMIDTNLIYEFAEWLNAGNYTNNGRSYAMATLNSIIKYAVAAIKCVPIEYISREKANTLVSRQLANKTSSNNEIALRDSEVIKLWKYSPTSKTDEEIRDMFLLLCLTGQRVGDLKKFQGGIEKIDGITCLKLVQQKCSHKIKIDIIFPLAINILNKYTKLPIIDIEKKINNNIGRIAKEAGICGTEQIARHYQGNDKPTVTEVNRTDLIHSHTGRRTFVSILKIHGWNYQDIKGYTGQSLKMVEHYDKSTTFDRRLFDNSEPCERLEILGDTNKQPQQDYNSHPQLKSLPNSIDEAKRVLNFLGVDSDDYIEIEDFDTLVRLISMREGEIIKGLNLEKLDKIKDIFNTNAPIKERKVHLHNLVTMWESEIGSLFESIS
ncbi:MAG: phage integrase SAM-like domain-containing protein [Muribaculaceae bacterium]|nr:phage integrase SAM-like domain-containing protein [Muribaculaceae bacterium]